MTRFRDSLGRVLFVAHSATRTGAPIVLLHFLRWLSANTSVDFEVLVIEDGPISSDFAALAPLQVFNPRDGPSSLAWRFEAKLAHEGLHTLAASLRRARFMAAVTGLQRFRTIYLNSVFAWELVPFLRRQPVVLIGHAHELGTALSLSSPKPHGWLRYAEELDGVIAASNAVVDALAKGGLPSERIRRHYEFINTAAKAPDAHEASLVRSRLGIPHGTPIVGGAGLPMWRKGPDLFVQLARAMVARRPERPLAFVWVGGGANVPDFWKVQYDLHIAGLETRVHFVETQADPFSLFAAFDVFAMTSREDPFPLVCLEAAWLGKPIVCFAGAGGIPELVGNNRGVVVPYLDVETMATQAWQLLDDSQRRTDIGSSAAAWVRAHHDVNLAAPALLEDIERFCIAARGRS